MIELYVATTNAGKLRDFAFAAAAEVGAEAVAIRPLPGLGGMPVPEETEETFRGNAALKARFYSERAPGVVVLADDSGLEVEALGGAPGVRSARFAADVWGAAAEGPGAGLSVDERNNACLLAEMERVGGARLGRYRCVLVAARDGEVLAGAEGSVEGEILTRARGAAGFGYDPLFLLPGLGLTMAEVDPGTRLGLSHRGQALRRLLPELRRMGV